jgi:hypothetical protein
LVVTSSIAPTPYNYIDVGLFGNTWGFGKWAGSTGDPTYISLPFFSESWPAMFYGPTDPQIAGYMFANPDSTLTQIAVVSVEIIQNKALVSVSNITQGGSVTAYIQYGTQYGQLPIGTDTVTVNWTSNGFYYLGDIPTDILTASFIELATSSFTNAEGNNTKATGFSSVAIGNYTLASENYSVAEGSFTTASGLFSHAGGIGTIASGSGQTVVGKYNIYNNTSSLFIVGNGANSGSRSDILNVNTNGINIYGTLSASAYQGIPYDLFGANSGSIVSGTNLFSYLSPRSFKIINLLKYTGNGSVDLQIRKNGISSSIPIQVSKNDLIEVYATTTGSRYYYTLEGII